VTPRPNPLITDCQSLEAIKQTDRKRTHTTKLRIVPTLFAIATLAVAFGRGGNISVGGYGVANLYVQSVWLGKSLKH
jgi:hypothetical protein